MTMKKYKFELGFTDLRYVIRDELKLSNHQYAIAHALSFVGKKNKQQDESKGDRTNYKPTIPELADDLGISEKTIYRALPILREKNIIEPDCHEATNYFVAMIMKKKKERTHVDRVEHGPRQELKLNFTEYLVCVIYDRLSQGQWATLDKKRIAQTANVTEQHINRVIKKMVVKGLMEIKTRKMKNGKYFNDIRMTEKWINLLEKETAQLSKCSSELSKCSSELSKCSSELSKCSSELSKCSPTNNHTNNHTNNPLLSKDNKGAARPKKEKKKNPKISGKEDKSLTPEKEEKKKIEKNINNLIGLFEPINSSYQTFYSDFVQRSFCKKLLIAYDDITIIKQIQKVKNIPCDEQYAPVILSPADLFTKWIKIDNYFNRQSSKIMVNRAPDTGRDYDDCKVTEINVDNWKADQNSPEETIRKMQEIFYEDDEFDKEKQKSKPVKPALTQPRPKKQTHKIGKFKVI